MTMIPDLQAGDVVEFVLAPGRYVADYDDDGGYVGGHWSFGSWTTDPDTGKLVWVEDDDPKRYTGILISHPKSRNGKLREMVRVRTKREVYEIRLDTIVAKVTV